MDQPRSNHPAGPRMAIVRRDGPRVTVTDYDAACYIFYRGVPAIDSVQVSRTIYNVVFYDPDSRIEQLVVDYANDERALILDAMRRLKKITRRLPGSWAGPEVYKES
jgi:hypothetical protein